MTDKQAVLDAIRTVPESASLDDIIQEVRLMAGVRRGRADILAGRAKTQEEVEQMFQSWASAWTTK